MRPFASLHWGCPHMIVSRRLFARSVTLIFGVLLLAASSCQAQWTLLKTFPSYISCVYFLDQQGSATTGFVGLENSTIWRTTDNGVSWNQASTPATGVQSIITAFTFRTPNQGWCSLEDYFGGTNGAIWETNDGGQTWSSIYTNAGSVVSIAYCAPSNELVAPCWDVNSVSSTDLGATWSTFAPSLQNGVTFSGSLGFVGVYSTLISTLYSVDGGITWNDAPSLDAETWSPYAIPGTSIFVAAAEKTRQFFLSTNGGASWTNPYKFASIPTGCTSGTAAHLFLQTTQDGFFLSTDLGSSWISICGPSNYRDTRFYSVGSQIFSGDDYANGNLWYLSDAVAAATASLHLDKSSITLTGVRCGAVDSILHITSSVACFSGKLIKAQIISGSPYFWTQGVPSQLSGNDSMYVLYTPSPSLKDSGELLLEFNLGAQILDTIIKLYGTGSTVTNFSIDPSLVVTMAQACSPVDSGIVIRNLSCDSLTVTALSLSDTSHFRILPIDLPLTIGSDDFDTIPIESDSKDVGNFSSEFEIQMLGAGGEAIKDSVPLALNVLEGAHVQIGALNLSVLDECSELDTDIMVYATPCDSIVLFPASISNTSNFRLTAANISQVIPAAGSVRVHIHVLPGPAGSDSSMLSLSYLSGGRTVDTTVSLSLKVLYDLPVNVALKDTIVDMGVVSAPCFTSSRWISFANSLCRSLSIDRIGWENAGGDFSVDSMQFPIVLSSDSETDSILVHFNPTSAGAHSNRLDITLDLDGRIVDTFITVFGTGTSSFHDSLLTPSLNFDTILACHIENLEGKLVNLSCDSVTATLASLASGVNYSVLSPALPKSLAPGDTLNVVFQLHPKSNNILTDEATITIFDPVDGKEHIDSIALSGYVIPSTHLLGMNSDAFSLPSIAPCSFVDSTIVLTNFGNCEDVVITDTTLVGFPSVTLALPSPLPLAIPPDSSVTISFRVSPSEDTIVSSQFTLRGQNIDTAIIFNYAAQPGAHTLAFSPMDSIFLTKPCVPVTRTFWVANVGCDSTHLENIVLNGAPNETEYSIAGLPEFPVSIPAGDTLFYTVTFDPSGNGNGSASLEMFSAQASINRSITLTGQASGIIPTARIGLQSSDHSMQCAGLAGDTTSIAAVLLDNVGDTTGLSTVLFTLNGNWNVLTLTKIVPALGWSITDTQTTGNGGLQIRLRYTTGGAIAAGTEMVTCFFAIAVSDSSSTDISLSGLRFNDSSATYDGCALTSVELPDPVHFSLTDTCGTPIVRSMLNGDVALQIISVRPNPVSPAGGSTNMELCIALARAAPVTITLSDMLGRVKWKCLVAVEAGTQTLPLELPNIPEGSYFLEVSSLNMQESRKVVVEGGVGKN